MIIVENLKDAVCFAVRGDLIPAHMALEAVKNYVRRYLRKKLSYVW